MTPTTPHPEQGPEWLGELLLSPPGWLRWVIILLGVATACAAVWRLSRRSWTVSFGQQREMLHAALMVGLIMMTAGGLRGAVRWPFWMQVGVAFVIGTVGSLMVIRIGFSTVDRDQSHGNLSVGWALIVLMAIGLDITALSQQLVSIGQTYLGLLGLAMLVYNLQAMQENNTDETQTETA